MPDHNYVQTLLDSALVCSGLPDQARASIRSKVLAKAAAHKIPNMANFIARYVIWRTKNVGLDGNAITVLSNRCIDELYPKVSRLVHGRPEDKGEILQKAMLKVLVRLRTSLGLLIEFAANENFARAYTLAALKTTRIDDEKNRQKELKRHAAPMADRDGRILDIDEYAVSSDPGPLRRLLLTDCDIRAQLGMKIIAALQTKSSWKHAQILLQIGAEIQCCDTANPSDQLQWLRSYALDKGETQGYKRKAISTMIMNRMEPRFELMDEQGKASVRKQLDQANRTLRKHLAKAFEQACGRLPEGTRKGYRKSALTPKQNPPSIPGHPRTNANAAGQ